MADRRDGPRRHSSRGPRSDALADKKPVYAIDSGYCRIARVMTNPQASRNTRS
jgi:hypothetical protein